MEEYKITQRPPRADKMHSRCKRRNYYLENGFIKPIKDSKPEEYNPFVFYRTGEKDKESLHRQFANINLSNDNEILEFYNKYGALGLFQSRYSQVVALSITDTKYDYKDKLSNVYAVERYSDYLTPIDAIINTYKIDKEIIPDIDDTGIFIDKNGYLTGFDIDACYTTESLQSFKSACNLFKSMLDLKYALDDKNYEEIKRLLIHYSKTYEEGIEEKSNEALLSSASTLIIFETVGHIEGMVTPLLQWNSEGTGISSEIAWRCDTLLSSIYMMLFMDISNGNLTRKCENEKCQKYFEVNSTKKDNIYCSSKCRNAVNVRRSRIKQELEV